MSRGSRISPARRTCSFDGCAKPHYALGLCRAHHVQQKRGTTLHPLRGVEPPRGCTFLDCDRVHDSHGYCAGHKNQLHRGEELKPLRRLKLNKRACTVCGWEFAPRSADHEQCSRCRGVKDWDRVQALRAPEGKKWCRGCQRYRASKFFLASAARCKPCHRQHETERRAQGTYGLPAGMYARLLAEQGGKCFICQRATGKAKALSVDHDHSCCSGLTSCGDCVRGLLCGGCNHKVLGHLWDSVEALERAIDYLTDPPYQRMRRGEAS